MNHVMVDIETTGLRPDRSAILQIAAVKFDLETGEVSTNTFDWCLRIPQWRHWDESTREWWLKQDRTILNTLFSRAEPTDKALEDFVVWVSCDTTQPLFWARNPSFDYSFISSYLHDFGLPNPFHYRNIRDMKSFAWARSFPAPMPEIETIQSSKAHNALVDCLVQVDWVLKAYKATGGHEVRSNTD